MILTGISLKTVVAIFIGSSLKIFIISSSWNSRVVSEVMKQMFQRLEAVTGHVL